MKLVKDLFIILLILLIKIGDGVLFLLSLPFRALKSSKHLAYQMARSLSLPKKKIHLPQLPRLHISIPRLSVPRYNLFNKLVVIKTIFSRFKLPRPTKKMVVEKPVRSTIKTKRFLSHVPLLTKFKYFIAGWTFAALFVFLPMLFVIFIQDLPSPKELTLRHIPQTTKIYDRNNILLYQIYAAQNRTLVPLSDIPVHLRNATIAIEDKDFYKHLGFDVTAIIRSAVANVSDQEILQGGSTITQQLIKSALLTPEKSFSRKVKEIILAFWAERMYSKDQILSMYFNQVAYGGTAWGVEAAAEVYFGKHVKDLDLAESAFLAGLPQAPTVYSPFGTSPDLWKKRQKEVLNRMTALGYISQKQADDAYKQELVFQTPQTPIHAPHFVMYVKDYLARKYGLSIVERGGLTVVTSLDLKKHQAAQKIVADQVQADAHLNLTNGAVVVTNPRNGDIVAMVGSKDFSDPNGGNVNLATSLRQPGSSIKIVTYATALSKGVTAATPIDDSPTTFPGSPPYTPVNYDGRFHGRVPLRLALANSYNIPAVKLLNQVGVSNMVSNAKQMGIKSWGPADNYGLSITLGSAEATMLEMSTVYGVFANGGVRVDPNPILKVSDYQGNILEEKKTGDNGIFSVNAAGAEPTPVGEKVIDEGVAFIVSSILSDNAARSSAFGPNSVLNVPGKTVSVKTGTSDNKRDNWTIGYTKDYVVTVWVGNNDNTPMSQQLASGITGAAPIWNKVITQLIADKPNQPLTPPSNIVSKNCYGRTEYFIKGTENSVNCNFVPTNTPTKKPN